MLLVWSHLISSQCSTLAPSDSLKKICPLQVLLTHIVEKSQTPCMFFSKFDLKITSFTLSPFPEFFSHVCLFGDNKNSTSFRGLLLLGFLSLRIHISQHQLGFFRNLSQLHDMASEASAALQPQCHRSAKPQSRCSNLASKNWFHLEITIEALV